MKQPTSPQDMNQEQVKNILKFIDASQSEAIKDRIFSQLRHISWAMRAAVQSSSWSEIGGQNGLHCFGQHGFVVRRRLGRLCFAKSTAS